MELHKRVDEHDRKLASHEKKRDGIHFKLNTLIDSEQKPDAKINRLLLRNTNGHSS